MPNRCFLPVEKNSLPDDFPLPRTVEFGGLEKAGCWEVTQQPASQLEITPLPWQPFSAG